MTRLRALLPSAGRALVRLAALALLLAAAPSVSAEGRRPPLPRVCDIDAARELCDSLPLEGPEGVWIYPQDHVTVLVRRIPAPEMASLPVYDISVVETTDCSVLPGESIGTLAATPVATQYELTLFTDRSGGMPGKPATCLATVSKEGDSMTLSREKSRLRLRLSFNPASILPALWKSLLRFGFSINPGSGGEKRPAPGMVRIHPSYDGNGSSRLKPRYL